jgi:hypothetical protein
LPSPVSLFRAVQLEEARDVEGRRIFATVSGSNEGKYFSMTQGDAERHSRLLQSRAGIGPSWIVEARVDPAIFERLTPGAADGRPALFVHQDDLDWFNEAIMELVVPPLG